MRFPTYSDAAARHALRTLPRLNMDEYTAFVAETVSQADPAKVARQKAIEECIVVPFRLSATEECSSSNVP